MEDFVLKLVEECKEFMRLSEMNKRSSFLPQGSPAYIVSKRWLKKYKEYLCLKEVKSRKSQKYQMTILSKITQDQSRMWKTYAMWVSYS